MHKSGEDIYNFGICLFSSEPRGCFPATPQAPPDNQRKRPF